MMTYEIVKQDNSGETVIMDGECDSYEDALEIYIDCVLDHGMDDSWLMEDYSRIKAGKNNIKYRRLLGWLEKHGRISEDFLPMQIRDDIPKNGQPYTLELKVINGSEAEDYGDMFTEGWDHSFDDKPENQYGEKWQLVRGTYLNAVIDDIIKDVQIDPCADGPRMESLDLGSLHICDDGHLIVTLYGGANGGGMRGEESNWVFYLALVKKFLFKLLEYDNNGKFFNDVWLVDWSNDCLDDCWTLVLGIELSTKEKAGLLECGDSFKVVDPDKLGIEIQQSGVDTIVKPVQDVDTSTEAVPLAQD